MNQQVQVDPQAFAARLQAEIAEALGRVAEAVNAAPDGQWIEGSEDEVCQVMAEFRQQAYETALQMRADAGEASFSPSDR